MPYFRFRWLDNDLLGYFPDRVAEFISRISALLEEEEYWIRDVKPSNTHSPLVLPQTTFSAHRAVRNVWDLAAEAAGNDRIKGAALAIQSFQQHHGHKMDSGQRAWADTGGRAFDYSGQRHGTAPFPRSWKYSYAIPPGFHFDVTAINGREFSITDSVGVRHTAAARGYFNVDPHGSVRV